MLKWFDATEAKKFGALLANFFMERMPLERTVDDNKTAAQKREELLEKMAQQVASFRNGHRMNIYKKAQLGNVFKWTLKDAGYDSSYVDQLTNWLMHRV